MHSTGGSTWLHPLLLHSLEMLRYHQPRGRLDEMELARSLLALALLLNPTMASFVEQPLARIAFHEALVQLDSNVTITASPDVLGVQASLLKALPILSIQARRFLGEGVDYVTVQFRRPSGADNADWIGVFSPGNFNSSICSEPAGVPNRDQEPLLCSAPVKYSYANFSTPDYIVNGEGVLKFRLINMRADYSFGFFKGDVTSPVLLAVSNPVGFANPKAPGYLRLAKGHEWNEITVTWTSGYGADEAIPLVKWGIKEEKDRRTTVAGTLAFTRNDMCGTISTLQRPFTAHLQQVLRTLGWTFGGNGTLDMKAENFQLPGLKAPLKYLCTGDCVTERCWDCYPVEEKFRVKVVVGAPASTIGWRDPGFIHTSSLDGLWPNVKYHYQVGHRLQNGTFVWGRESTFKSPPFPGQDSLQRVIIFGDMGKAERDGSNEFNNYQPGSLNTTDTLIKDLDNYDLIIHIGDLAYSNGYLAQWDQFIEQVEVLSSQVPYMTGSGNHERDWPFSGSFYNNIDSGGECGVPSKTLFTMPVKNGANYWYETDWGMFHFCIADTEQDWREGSDQYKFLEQCFASVDRQKQPWLIFLAHRVLGYSSNSFYAKEGTFSEPGGREDMEKLWQKYKVDLAFYGHVHSYERTCPVFQSICVSQEREHYSGQFNATIHVVAGGGGAGLSSFAPFNTTWSYFKDNDFGFTKLTAYNHSSLLVEYKRSDDGQVYDKFWFSRNYKDVLGCDKLNVYCPKLTLAM